MNTQVNESVMTKIKNLLAMAEHEGSNEHEAAIAMEKAQALLFQYNLSRTDIKDGLTSTPAGIGKIDGTESSGYIWKRVLLNYLATANLCHVVVSPSHKKWHLFGTYNNVQIVLEIYRWLIPELEFIALREYRKYKNDGGYESGLKWKRGFFYGASKAIKDRLAAPLNDFKQGTGHDLVIYNEKAVSEAVKRVFPRLGHTTLRASYSDGIGAGRTAGANIHLKEQRKLSGVLALGNGR